MEWLGLGNPRSVTELRELIDGVTPVTENERLMVAHIRGDTLPPSASFSTDSPLAEWLFPLVIEYDKATVLDTTRRSPLRVYGDRCRCGRCGAFMAEGFGSECSRCCSWDRRFCDRCYEGYLSYQNRC